jgi:hypothetical protein
MQIQILIKKIKKKALILVPNKHTFVIMNF